MRRTRWWAASMPWRYFFEDGFHRRMGQDQFAQVTHVGLAPVGLALVAVAVAQQEGLEPEAAAALVINGIGAGAAQIADGFIGGFGHIDAGQFAGAQEPSNRAGVAFIGLEGRAGLLGDEGGSGDQAGHLKLLEPPGDAKTAGASLVGNLQECPGVSFADAAQGHFQAAQVIGDGAEEPDLVAEAGRGDSDGDGVFVDIEAEIQCNSLHGVVVSSYSHDESERYRASCTAVLAALPTRATRDPNERQPHRSFQPSNPRRRVARQP